MQHKLKVLSYESCAPNVVFTVYFAWHYTINLMEYSYTHKYCNHSTRSLTNAIELKEYMNAHQFVIDSNFVEIFLQLPVQIVRVIRCATLSILNSKHCKLNVFTEHSFWYDVNNWNWTWWKCNGFNCSCFRMTSVFVIKRNYKLAWTACVRASGPQHQSNV